MAELQASLSSAGSVTSVTLGFEPLVGGPSMAEPQAGSMSSDGMQTQYDLQWQPGDTVWSLPRLSASYLVGVESLSRLPPGKDKYLISPASFGAIDSIAVVGNMAYLFQITQDPQHEINNFLLVVLAYLPEHLQVEFIWVFPLHVWKKANLKQKQLPDLTAYLSKSQATPSKSSAAQKEGVQKALPQQRHAHTVASKQELVARRLQACEEQYNIGGVAFREWVSQPSFSWNGQRIPGGTLQPKQTAAEASLRTAVGSYKAAVSSVRYPSQVKLLPLAIL